MKQARDGSIEIIAGMWASTLVMVPLGIFLTYKSNKDSTVINGEYYWTLIKRFFGVRAKRNFARKEIIITPPDYDDVLQQLQQLTLDCQEITQRLRLNQPANYVKMFFLKPEENQVKAMANRLEHIIEQLSNSDDNRIVGILNEYPVPYENAHTSPTNNKWINLAMGILFPIGLLVWGRACIFRTKLKKDIIQITETNNMMEITIGKKMQSHS